jgi:hypothetical protein
METIIVELTVGDGRSIEAEYSYVSGRKAAMTVELGSSDTSASITEERPVRTIFEEACWDTGEELSSTEFELYIGRLDNLAQDEALRKGL